MASNRALKHWAIDKAGRKWNTRPEQNFNSYQVSRGMGLVQNVKLPFTDLEKHHGYTFQLDFAHPNDHTYDVDYEVDGSHYHGSDRQLAKDEWKDRLKNAQGLKVIHVPAVLTEKKWWAYLDEWLPKALVSVSPTVYLVA
ncbi:MAG: hypothetical protein KGH74_03635 [Candidatus Micrarchaeota archaeon]|nr:hypothetical protein [Candidatus Micrarchaeota archaeon]